MLLFSVKIFIEIIIFFCYSLSAIAKNSTIFSLLRITLYHIGHYRLTVRISISIYDAFFKKRLLCCDSILKRNSDFTQQRTCSSRRCCNQNQKWDAINNWQINNNKSFCKYFLMKKMIIYIIIFNLRYRFFLDIRLTSNSNLKICIPF